MIFCRRITLRFLLLSLSVFNGYFAAFAQELSPRASEKPIQIGATLALSGKLAFSGVASRRGLELGVQSLNKTGGVDGRALALVIDDNGGEAGRAVSGVTKLLNVDRIDIVFSSLTHISQALKDIVRQHAKLFIYSASVGGIAAENPLAFRDWGDITEQMRTLFSAVSGAGVRKVALISEQSDACNEGFTVVRRLLEQHGETIVADENFNPGETDFRSLLLKVVSKKPDAFIFCAWRDAGTIMRQIKQIGLISIPSFHALAPFLPDNDTPEVRALYAENRSQSVWSGLVPGAKPQSDAQQFVELFKVRFGEEPRMEAAFAYDDMIVLGQALRACHGISDPSCVAARLQGTAYNGAGGRLSFDQHRCSNRESFMIKVKDGSWVRAE